MSKWRMSLSAGVVIVMAVVFAYLRITTLLKQSAHSIDTPLEQTVITEPTLLEKTNPAFYGGVKDGDVVLRYQDRLDLYRPSESRVIRSTPLGK